MERQSRHRRRTSRASEYRELDREDLRRARADYFDGERTSNLVRRPAVKEKSRSRKSQSHRRTESGVRIRRRYSSSSDGSASYVYSKSAPRTPKSRTVVSDRNSESTTLDSHTVVTPDNVGPKKEKALYIDGKTLRPSKQGSRRSELRSSRSNRVLSPELRLSRRSSSRRPGSIVLDDSPSVARSTSGRQPRTHESRPPVTRARTQPNSNTQKARSGSAPPPSTRERRNSFLGSMGKVFGASIALDSVKLVSCSACLADDIPKAKAASLKCGHRICNSCMKRIFKLSVTDPQHMPPKCCTADHIPLKHVDKLFDLKFKKQWNKKYQEYTTKNRIYCPGKRCGEWIRPQNIRVENGRKCGKCSNCKLKVCGVCNGKWHGNRDCQTDDETRQILEQAAQSGWQRCYNCRSMVELKEGCNHMTCRCKAEFCMCCGYKWKTCDCPWFSYSDEDDPLTTMRIPLRARAYAEELTNNRSPADERLARRLTTIPTHPNPSTESFLDYNGGIGHIEGVGNASAHFMNESYVRIPPNMLGMGMNHVAAAANYVMGVRNERDGGRRSFMGPVPRISTNDRYPTIGPLPTPRTPPPAPVPPYLFPRPVGGYEGFEGPARRVSLRRPVEIQRSPIRLPAQEGKSTIVVVDEDAENTRRSILAGLDARGSGGTGRVNAWRAHVGAGVVPREGVLNIVN